MLELDAREVLVTVWTYSDGTFNVIRDFYFPKPHLADSIFIVTSYPCTPWPRKGGNLLW